MIIQTCVAPSAREWAVRRATELASMSLADLRALGYEEASGMNKTDTIGMILAADAPTTDDELWHGDPGQWDYTFEVESENDD